MDWASIVSAGISGGLAAGIAYFVVRNPKERRVAYVVVVVVVMWGINSLSKRFVLPQVFDWQAEREIRRIPVYHEIADNDPETYRKIRTTVLQGLRNGERQEVVASRVSTILANSLPRYIGRASDESVIAFADLMVRETDHLGRTDPDACYHFLFPHQYGAPDLLGKYLGEKDQKDSLDVMGRIFHSAMHAPQPLPEASQSEALLDSVTSGLYKDFGPDLLVLQKIPADTAGRKKVCLITTALYKRVLNLPKKESGMLLRYMLSKQ